VVRRIGESGVALLWAMLALLAVATSVLLVASLLDERQVTTDYEYRSVVLTSLSDAAFAATLARMSIEPGFPGVTERRLGDGTISSTVAVTLAGTRLVTATGRFDDWRSVITAEVAFDQEGPRIVRVSRRQVVGGSD
jgi:hypothetical protein